MQNQESTQANRFRNKAVIMRIRSIGVFSLIRVIALWAVIALPAAVAFGASPVDPYEREFLLYDLDYRNRTKQIGQTVPIEDGILPGRSSPSEQIFGTMTIQADPHAHSPTAALMNRASDAYSQFGMSLYNPTCLFRSHRLEFAFMFDADVGELALFPDYSGMLSRISFEPDGSVRVWYNSSLDNSIHQLTVVVMTNFNPAVLVEAELDIDRRAGQIRLSINGVESTIEDVGDPKGPFLRNRSIAWGPSTIRCSYGDSTQPMSLYYMRVWGRFWEGPLYLSEGQSIPENEASAAIIPASIPFEGRWQGEYSFDLNTWVPFSGYYEGTNSINRMLTGSRFIDECFFRLQEIRGE